MSNQFTVREQIIELCNRLFIYTDNREWNKLKQEVFTENVLFDMSSLGAGDPVMLPAAEICAKWETGFQGIDQVHHQAGNYIVDIVGGNASVHAYAIAIHHKNSAVHGKTRQFVGTYNLRCVETPDGWRMSGFKYNLKYAEGNVDLK